MQRSTVRQGTGDHDCSSLAHCPLIAQRAGPQTCTDWMIYDQASFNSLNNGSIHNLKAAFTFLSEQPGVDESRLGAVGYYLGGMFAVRRACTDDRLKAIAPYYATNPRPLKAAARLCPVVGSYPGNDFTASSGRKLDVELDRYNVPHDIKIYPGAKHSFFNDTLRDNYNESSAQDSWRRVLGFFGERIGAKAEV